jgi:hypothetical protein
VNLDQDRDLGCESLRVELFHFQWHTRHAPKIDLSWRMEEANRGLIAAGGVSAGGFRLGCDDFVTWRIAQLMRA